MGPLRHWLDELEDLFRSFSSDAKSPLCFLIGAGASLSSGAPGTPGIVAALMTAQPNLFPDRESVYAKLHQLTTDDRRAVNSRLFGNVVPYIGYRCLAAMARVRPIIIINLNWDNCAVEACRRLGIPDRLVTAVSLEDTDKVAAEATKLIRRKKGLLSVHVHGWLEDPDGRDPRFGTRETLTFSGAEFEQLQRLLNYRTIVIGTSLSGHHDVPTLVEALLPPDKLPDSKIKRLWVIERGEPARLPSPLTDAGHELTRALADRRSPSNFIASPDVDFDMFMVALRAAEVGFTWEDVKHGSNARLPARSELVPPNPEVVRPLLDSPGVLVGRADVGKGVVAYQVAHWLSILGEERPQILAAKGGEAISAALKKSGEESPPPVVVGEHSFGKDTPHSAPGLTSELDALAGSPRAILTSRPSSWFAAIDEDPTLSERIPMIPFQCSQVWGEGALKAYARLQASPWRAADIEEAVERGELSTPRQVDRAIDAVPMGSRDGKEPAQLIAYLKRLRRREPGKALALALIRLQDMSHAVPQSHLEEACDASLDDLVGDPWELVAAIRIDDDYLRLARREAVLALDKWMSSDREWLDGQIVMLGERFRWAREALNRWARFREFDAATQSLADFAPATIELLGPELIEPALGISPKKAMRVLQEMFETAQDAWAVREVGFELVRRWGTLRTCPKARKLRDELIADKDRRGLYALFEGMLRHGGTASAELWGPVVTGLLAMLKNLDEERDRRQVALCFDALLWRRAPVAAQDGREMLELLLEAAKENELLLAACAAGAAYHWDGARHLTELELPNPLDDLGNVSEAAAREMAWVVEWHFVHQSRNRAVASRRYFRSTRIVPASAEQARLLSRKALKRPLPKEAARGVQKVVAQLGRFASTAGWGVHMTVNVCTTSGKVDVPNLARIVGKAKVDDPGLIWAAITYEPPHRLGEELRAKLQTRLGHDGVQMALSGKLTLDGTKIQRPRFVTSLDPWQEVRKRLHMDADILADLHLPEDDPWQLVEIAREVRDDVVAAGAEEDIVDEVIEEVAAGDMRLIEYVHSHDARFSEPARVKAKKAPDDLRGHMKSLLLFATHIVAGERETR